TPLPRDVGPWHATEQQRLADGVIAAIKPDSHLMQLYEAPGRTPIWLYIGVYAGRGSYGKAAHDPEVCYPAQGWDVLRSESLGVPLGDSEVLHAKHFEARRDSVTEAVIYWFQPAMRWPESDLRERFLRVLDAVNGRPQYAFVRLSGLTDGGTATKRDLIEFAAGIALSVRTVVDNEDDGSISENERRS
ncbi:MAG: EpsI family protein, partial [Deltaproteobacteria bacterium]|nr:EpsI family protein [Deltaproteobacteria bacterium]